jgi:hypothetical protein
MRQVLTIAAILWIGGMATYHYVKGKPRIARAGVVAAFFILIAATLCSLAAVVMFVQEKFPGE